MIGTKSVFKSKVGAEVWIPTFLILCVVMALMVWPTVIWFGLITLLLTMAFVLYVFFSICYEVRGDILVVSCGWLYREEIPISEISEIRKSGDISSAPAASLRRLEIRYGKGKRVLVSPKWETDFINMLCSMNREIQLDTKLTGDVSA